MCERLTHHPEIDASEIEVQVKEGEVTLVDKDGRQEHFKAGDTLFVPRGTEFAWKQPAHFRKFYASFDRETPAR